MYIATDKPSAMRLSPVDVPPSEPPAVAPSTPKLFGRFFAVTFLVVAAASAVAVVALSRSSASAPTLPPTAASTPKAPAKATRLLVPSIHVAADAFASEIPPVVAPAAAGASEPSPQSSARPHPRSAAHKPQSLAEVPDELPY